MESDQCSYEALPQELKQEIFTTALATSKNFSEIINVMKNISALHGAHYDHSTIIDLLAKQLPDDLDKTIKEVKSLQGATLKDFTALMDVLAKKFPDEPRELLAEKFKTQVAGSYNRMANTFLKSMDDEENPETALTCAIKLLNQGVDPNYSWIGPRFIMRTLLLAAYNKIFAQPATYGNTFDYNNGNESMIPILTLLLDRGVKPNAHLMEHATRMSQRYPTELNIKLLALLQQAVENK